MLTLCATAFIQAQSVTLEKVSSRGFNGVKSVPGKAYYTFYFGEKTETKNMANFVLELYDLNLKKINTATIELTKNSELAGSCFSGENFLFVFTDITKKTLSMITLDEKGVVVQKKVQEDVNRGLLSPDNYSNLLAADNGEFIIIRPIKEKKLGYVIERMDKNLATKWSKEFAPEKGSWEVLTSKINEDRLYLLRHDKKSVNGSGFENTIYCYETKAGEEVYSYKLYDGEASGFPSVMNVDEKGNLVTGGMYFNGTKFDESNSDGLFFLVLDRTGKSTAYSKTTWKTVQDKIAGAYSSALIGGKTKVLVEDVVRKNDGTYTIISETFRKSNNANLAGSGMAKMALGGKSNTSSTGLDGKEVGFTIMDFVFFNFDKTGTMTSLAKIDKSEKAIVIRGSMANENALKIALFMSDANMFCYRYMVEYSGKQYVVYKNKDGFKTKAYFLPIDATTTKGIAELDLSKNISDDMNKLGKVSSALNGGDDAIVYETGSFGQMAENPEKYANIIPGKTGDMLLYNYQNGTMNIWLEPVPVK
jgi:hypothetical protein